MSREVILDTETTGLSWADGHRIVEIGAVELVSRLPTGRTFHHYLDPQRDMDAEVIRIHGITNERLKGMPVFADVVDKMLDFLGDAPLVIHNAGFDVGFINAEMGRVGRPPLANEVVDTLGLARKKFPGAQSSLDALCRRFNVDLSDRTFHGALLDAKLLSHVYVELTGGLQPTLALTANGSGTDDSPVGRATTARPARSFPPTEDELARHAAFVKKIPGVLWAALAATPPDESK